MTSPDTPILGLLGAPGSGKSYVAHCFEQLGCAIIDADQLAREALQSDPVKAQIVEWWGGDMLDEQGQVSRPAVASIVFENPEALEQLESIIHPIVHQQRQTLHAQYRADPDVRAIIEDCPLLIEKGLDVGCDWLVFIEASRDTRLARVQEHRGWDAAELDRRESKQASLDTKRARADYVVRNDIDEQAQSDVRHVMSSISPL